MKGGRGGKRGRDGSSTMVSATCASKSRRSFHFASVAVLLLMLLQNTPTPTSGFSCAPMALLPGLLRWNAEMDRKKIVGQKKNRGPAEMEKKFTEIEK